MLTDSFIVHVDPVILDQQLFFGLYYINDIKYSRITVLLWQYYFVTVFVTKYSWWNYQFFSDIETTIIECSMNE